MLLYNIKRTLKGLQYQLKGALRPSVVGQVRSLLKVADSVNRPAAAYVIMERWNQGPHSSGFCCLNTCVFVFTYVSVSFPAALRKCPDDRNVREEDLG